MQLKFLIGIWLVLIATACSFKQAVYRYSDWVLENRFDHYLDLNSDQKRLVKTLIDESLEKINDAVLAPLASEVQMLGEKGGDGRFDQQDADWLLGRYFHYRTVLFSLIADPLSKILATVSDEQIFYFKKELAENNKEAEERLALDEDSYREKQLKKTLQRFEHFYGELSAKQEIEVAQILEINRKQGWQRLKIRKEMQASAIEMLEKHLSAEEISAQIKIWAKEPWRMIKTPSLQKTDGDRWQLFIKRIVAIDAIIEPNQRKHMKNELFTLATDLKVMSQTRFR